MLGKGWCKQKPVWMVIVGSIGLRVFTSGSRPSNITRLGSVLWEVLNVSKSLLFYHLGGDNLVIKGYHRSDIFM